MTSLYGDNKEEAATFDVDLVFANLAKRENLGSQAASISTVDCGKGFCGPAVPDGKHQKKLEFYVGTFGQNFDLRSYPFDSQVFQFNFTIVTSFGEVAMYSPPKRVAMGATSGAYHFDSIMCESATSIGGTSGYCWVTAQRAFAPTLVNVIIPSILFVLISILTLNLNVKLAMPRVGATLFALLILVQYRNSVVEGLPDTVDFAWIDLFLLLCAIMVWLVLVCHVVSDHLHQTGHSIAQRNFDQVSRIAMPGLLVMGLVIVSLTNLLDPPNPDAVATAAAICAVMLLIMLWAYAWNYRRLLRVELAKKAFEGQPSRRNSAVRRTTRRMWESFLGVDNVDREFFSMQGTTTLSTLPEGDAASAAAAGGGGGGGGGGDLGREDEEAGGIGRLATGHV